MFVALSFDGVFFLEKTMAAFIVLVVMFLTIPVCYLIKWYQDYKAWKFHKNRSRPLNPWSDW
ncbi:hypothetical protein DKE47_006290 [Acinetobacter nosocomialis]|nr:hypothetical protein DKE47_006290 [Acinetobacter nosocomialis]